MSRHTTCTKASDDVLLGEVAAALGIARSTAWARAIRGAIPAEFRGGRYLVDRRVLKRLVRENDCSNGQKRQQEQTRKASPTGA